MVVELVVGLIVLGVVASGMVGLWHLTGPLDRPTDEEWGHKEDK